MESSGGQSDRELGQDSGPSPLPDRFQQAMRPQFWIVAIPAMAVAYYFGIALPSYNEERLTLDRQKYADEQKRRDTEAKKVEEDAASRQQSLDSCFAAVETAYWNYVKLNGTELKDGKVRAPATVWNTADKRKNDERDTCFKRYPLR